MKFLYFPFSYLVWHYSLAIRDLVIIIGNLLWFLYHYFSIPILIKTLFSPWRRLSEHYSHNLLKPGEFFSTLIVNLLMRFFGFIVRSAMIIIGVVVWIGSFLFSILLMIFWLFLPFIIPTLIFFGGYLMIT
ncbi:MAG: hypothetical protein AAB453_04730 [Patescibacteria group bacterium]